jgi:prepilin-type N-terminal cleavage/methylation domain-containing protein
MTSTNGTARAARPGQRGFTLAEVLVVAGVAGIIVALLLPAVQSARERSRQVACGNNLRQLMLAAQGDQAAQGAFPVTSVISGDLVNGRLASISRSISPHRSLLAYIDPAIFNKLDFNDATAPLENVAPTSNSEANRELLDASIPTFLCPSDRAPLGGNNYRANMGTGPGLYNPRDFPQSVAELDPGNRTGAWVNGNRLRPQEFRDGLSQTVMFSEKTIGDGNPAVFTAYRDRFLSPVEINLAGDAIRACRVYASQKPQWHDSYSGTTWLYGGWSNTWYNHVVGPNSRIPDCSHPQAFGGGVGLYGARSFHPAGVYVALGDGAVRFVSDDIDLGVWRALSTRAGAEVVSD